jgi:glycogen operon protein
MCFNAHYEPIDFTLPPEEFGRAWVPVVDTSILTPNGEEPKPIAASNILRVEARTVVVLQADDH